jgi:predicted acyl esterase
VPAVIEYIPYGKRVGTRERDEAMHPWFAGHGFAALRVDLRGSGESAACCSTSICRRSRKTAST